VCIQKFPDWPPAARTAHGTTLCHRVQLYHYFVSQSSGFYCHNPLCCFSKSVYCCLFRYDSVRRLLDTLSYNMDVIFHGCYWWWGANVGRRLNSGPLFGHLTPALSLEILNKPP